MNACILLVSRLTGNGRTLECSNRCLEIFELASAAHASPRFSLSRSLL